MRISKKNSDEFLKIFLPGNMYDTGYEGWRVRNRSVWRIVTLF